MTPTPLPVNAWMARWAAATPAAALLRAAVAGRDQSGPHEGPHVVALAGPVSVGKSTLAEALRREAAGMGMRAAVVGTDSFLHPNAVLEDMGILDRKGFPESYDHDRMARFLDAVGTGQPAEVPVYSHDVYDIVGTRMVPAADLVVVEGIDALQAANPLARRARLRVYLDADDDVVIGWYVARFMDLCEAARADPDGTSFYLRFASLSPAETAAFARQVWDMINGPNLDAHIRPSRAHADLVLRKAPDHRLIEVLVT